MTWRLVCPLPQCLTCGRLLLCSHRPAFLYPSCPLLWSFSRFVLWRDFPFSADWIRPDSLCHFFSGQPGSGGLIIFPLYILSRRVMPPGFAPDCYPRPGSKATADRHLPVTRKNKLAAIRHNNSRFRESRLTNGFLFYFLLFRFFLILYF